MGKAGGPSLFLHRGIEICRSRASWHTEDVWYPGAGRCLRPAERGRRAQRAGAESRCGQRWAAGVVLLEGLFSPRSGVQDPGCCLLLEALLFFLGSEQRFHCSLPRTLLPSVWGWQVVSSTTHFFVAEVSNTCQSPAADTEPQRSHQSLGEPNVFGVAFPFPSLPKWLASSSPFPPTLL